MFLKKNLLLLLILATLFSLSSCKDDQKDEPPIETPTYEDGIFITNQGQFGNGTGTVSFYSRKKGEVTNKIFQEANDGEELGNIVQSIAIHNDLAYIVVNNAEKIVIADASTFKKVGEITSLKQPRYFLPINDQKAFVSQWGADGVTGSIKVIDLTTNKVSNTIGTRPGPEGMVKVDDVVYIANSGGFGQDSVISKIDIATETVLTTIEVGQGPDHIVLDKNNDLWVLGHGNYSTFANGSLDKISNDNLALSMETTNGAANLIINSAGDAMYFVMNGLTYEHPITENTIRTTPFISRYFYGLGIDPQNEDFIALDAEDFQGNGQMIIYNTTGTAMDSLKVGIVPAGLWFE